MKGRFVLAVLVASIAASVAAAPAGATTGVFSGTSNVCVSSVHHGQVCGTMSVPGQFNNPLGRAAVLEFACQFSMTSTNAGLVAATVGVSIPDCHADSSNGDTVQGIPNGNAGPTTAAVGAGTVASDSGAWFGCMKATVLLVDETVQFPSFCSFTAASI